MISKSLPKRASCSIIVWYPNVFWNATQGLADEASALQLSAGT